MADQDHNNQQPQQPTNIVAATGVAVGVQAPSKTALAEALEKAMTEAVQKAHNDGLSDPDKIRERILQARDTVLEQPPQQDVNNG
jgi:hypothetical protein